MWAWPQTTGTTRFASRSSESDYSLIEFMREYPDDAACLEALWREKFAPDGHHAHCPKCDASRIPSDSSTQSVLHCDSCGFQIYPMKGTIFEKSTTSLQLWFYAMYLIASTRCGISAKQLERELGVTYKTAWRMFNKIRNDLMGDDDDQLAGDVEVDETSWAASPVARKRPQRGRSVPRGQADGARHGRARRPSAAARDPLTARTGP